MPYETESLAALNRRLAAELPITGSGTALRRNLYTPFARALAGAVHGLHGHIEWRTRQMFPQTCDDDVLEYLPNQKNAAVFNQNNNWQKYKDFPERTLPDQVAFSIQPLEQRYENANNSELLSESAPKLIWLGNGEVKPVRIQFYFEERPVGNEIEIDHLGKIIDES